ncbi:hypothetical protein [Prosthecobacter sp.]|uniref:hypothetical protein n=1 Tax=Prosthecobacter sp. TaxID=1965333 RepID=UPI002ABAF768|nr:hypothetical protein [Prosthecobacter sp.]MDZ4402989.1 hypothetical protein [Prosthecobacter sp.]
MKRIILTLVLAGLSPVCAQVLPGAPGGTAAPPSNNTATGGEKKSDAQMLGGLAPAVDPGSENVSWDGKLWNISNNRVMRSRFEVYLTTPEAKNAEDQAYRDVMAQILELLAPTHKPAPELMKAFALLPEAGTAKIDGGLCNAIANSIWDVWTSQKRVNERKLANNAMLDRRKQLEWNAEMGLNNNQLAPPGGSSNSGASKGGQGQQQANQTAQMNSATVGRTSGYIKGIAEIEARMKMNETAMGLSEITSKTQFQALIIQMFLQRRFEHAVIACRFYPNLFRDGDSVLQLDKDSDVQKALSSSFGVPPTVSMIDGLSLEAIRSVDEALVAFEQLSLRQDLYSAGNRLMEAFGIGEYLPRVRRLPMSEKLKVLDFVRDSNQLLSFLEMKDYGEAEKVVVKLRTAAKDFDYAKPQAAIETAKTISDMRLQAARAAAVKGDQNGYATEIKAAAEIWPTNPKLRELSNMVGQNSDIQAQALMDFDRLVSQRNYRQVFNDQARFLAASINDSARQEQLKKVLVDMNRVNMIIHGASETARSSPAQAWEMVEKEARQFPDDPELTKLRADLGVKASDFVSAIEHGRQHEEKKQVGSALSWYLKAKRMHPPSELARDGVKRLVEVVKSGDQPPPAPTETTSALNN